MYGICLVFVVGLTVLVRSLFLETFPRGFHAHAIGHAQLRLRLYNALFVDPWDARSWSTLKAIVIQEQHGPQSLIEACLTPIFGFGFTESRLIVGVLGLLGVFLIWRWGTVAIDKWFGLTAALVLGMAPYFLHFSRNGDSEHVNIYWHVFLLLLTAQRVVSRGRTLDYIALGIATGLSFYVYATNQFLAALVLPIVVFVKLVQSYALNQNPIRSISFKGIVSIGCGVLVAAPQLSQYWRAGRTLPLRTSYGVLDQDPSFKNQFFRLWQELFIRGGDPWFARQEGSLKDWGLLLIIPGLFMLFKLSRDAVANLRESAELEANQKQISILRNSSILFVIIIAVVLVGFGATPGILSREPTFRRIVLLPIGLDIIRTLGVYGTILLILRKTPKISSYVITLLCLLSFTYSQWHAFYYDSHSSEGNSTHSLTAVVREVCKQVRSGKNVSLFLPEDRLLLSRAQVLPFLNFQLSYPRELPPNLRILDMQDLTEGYEDVIVPIATTRRILSGQVKLPEGVKPMNIRNFANRGGETFSLINFTNSSAMINTVRVQ